MTNKTKFMPKEQYDFMHKKPIMVPESMTYMKIYEVFLFKKNVYIF